MNRLTDPTGGPTHAMFSVVADRYLNISIGIVDHEKEHGVISFYNISYSSMDWPDQIYNILTENITHTTENMDAWRRFDDGFITGESCTKDDTPFFPLASSATILETKFVDLKPNTNYIFNITACNQVGCAEPTNLTITTITNKTVPGSPDCFPNISFVYNTSSTSIMANWTHLTHYCKNGDFVRYHTIIFDEDENVHLVTNKSLITYDDIANRMINYTTTQDWFEFEKLRKYWKYSFFVIYENVVGMGPLSNLVSVFTDEDGKFSILLVYVESILKYLENIYK